MDWLSGLVVGIGLASLAYALGRRFARMEVRPQFPIVAPTVNQGPSRHEFDALEGRVKKIALEWEDAHDRLLRMVRSYRAAARAAAGANGEDEPAGEAPKTDRVSPLTRGAVLAEYRRKNASPK